MTKYIVKQKAISALINEANTHSNPVKRAYTRAATIIEQITAADVQPIVYAHKTINVGRRSYCSNCGKLAIMEDFCSKCGAKVKDGEPTRNLTDEETEIYESWIDHEAKDTGVNIMDGE